ncbi:MAG: cation:proton antiporter [Candidatus Omnitrophota bacterium]|jgi:CPA2 family monovalent cation:H+ antiporter-2
MDHRILIEDWAVVMAVSALIVTLCHAVKLPSILGYILAGVVIGPYTPPHLLVTDLHSINVFADLGIILLLFHIGLEFSLKKIFRLGVKVLTATLFKTVLMMGLGFGIGRAFGWNRLDSIFLGAILTISSTAIVGKYLLEHKLMREHPSQVMLGILIVEDFFAILIVTMLSNLATPGALSAEAAFNAVLKGGGFILGFLLIGVPLAPRLVRRAVRLDHSEITVITVLGLCFSSSVIAVKCGFSPALGAFLMGAVIAEMEEAQHVIRHMVPIRDMFTAIFFVSVGLLIDPKLMVQYWQPVLLITLLTIPAKLVTGYLANRLAGYDFKTAAAAGLGLAQIGEFSFIIAQIGDTKDVTSPFLYSVAVAAAAVTTVTTPLLIRHTPAAVTFLGKYLGGKRIPAGREQDLFSPK